MTERASGQDFENDRELFPEELAERYEPLECVKSKDLPFMLIPFARQDRVRC